MDFIKKHLITLLCAVAGVSFLGVTVWGMTRTSVRKAMEKRVSEASSIRSYRSNPINQDKINDEKKRGEDFEKQFQATLNVAHTINKRLPLMEGVFPNPESDTRKLSFVQKYRQAIKTLPVQLSASGPPTPAEVADEQENVNDLLAMEQELKEDTEDEQGSNTRARRVRRRPQRSGFTEDMGFTGGGEMDPMMHGGGARMGDRMQLRGAGEGGGRGWGGGGGMTAQTFSAPTGEPKYDPNFRAIVAKARSIRCYADFRSFHISPIVDEQTVPVPSPDQLWMAQVGLWIQQDVTAAIKALNDSFAATVTSTDAHVEHMPVKRIERIRVIGYQLKSGLFPFDVLSGTQGSSAAAEDARPSFTHSSGDEELDVIRFSVAATVDQRHILKLVDQITKANFYKCVDIDYRAVDPADAQLGYMYGTAPVVSVTMAFEGYMARAVYAVLMPKTIRQRLGIDQGEDQDEP